MSNFIETFYLEDLSLCDDIIDYMHSMESKWYKGLVNGGELNPEVKDCDQWHLEPETEIYRRYCKEIVNLVQGYIKKYPYCNEGYPWGIGEDINLQKYDPPGQAFHQWHCERNGLHPGPAQTRHLVWMTYLNDVEEGGETEFLHQEIKIKPKKGLTVFWPVEWTHTHRGLPPISNTKYIATSWFNYFPRG